VTANSFSSKSLLRCASLFGVLLASNILLQIEAWAATQLFDTDGQASTTDCSGFGSAFTTIQTAVNAASSGDTIYICPGVYNEQIRVTKSGLTIRGSGAGLTVLRPTAVAQNTTSIISQTSVAPILLVDGVNNVTIANMTVDGSAADSGAVLVPNCLSLPFYIGIFYRASSGAIDAAQVTGITSGKACADAIRVESGNVAITRNLVDHYGRAGIGCAGANGNCSITGNTVQGLGKVNNQTQVGIQVRAAAGAVISGNVITDNFLIGAHGVPASSVGITLFNAQPSTNPHLVTENVFVNNQVNIQRQSTAAAL